MKSLKQLGKDIVLYGVGGALAKLISLLLLPIYTRLFPPEIYGMIELLNMMIAFMVTFMVMGTDSAQSFYFFQQAKNGERSQGEILTSVLQWRIFWGGICVAFGGLFFGFFNSNFFHGDLTLKLFIVACLVAFFQQLQQQSIEISRLLYKPITYFILNISYILIAASFSLILIIVFNQGVEGYFFGLLIASILATCIGWISVKPYFSWRGFNFEWWPRLIKFGAPLIPSGFGMYVLNTSDRWFISNFRGAEELGLYAVGAKFSMTIALIVQTFRLAWAPIAMESMQNDSGKDLFKTVSRLYMGFAVAGVVFLTALAPFIISFITPAQYWEAFPIVGVLAWYPVFYGFYLIISSGIWKKEKTAWTPFLMWGAAVLNIALNAILVPKYGSFGAAFATSISFFFWNVSVLVLSEKFWYVGYPYVLIASQVLIGIVACFAISQIYSESLDFYKSGSIMIFTFVLLGILSISKDEFFKLARSFHRKFSC